MGGDGNAMASSAAAGEGAGGGVKELTEEDSAAILFEKKSAAVLNGSSLLKRLQMVERAVQQNAYHRKQLDYRDLPDVPPLSLGSAYRQSVSQGDTGGGMFGGFGARGGLGSTTPGGDVRIGDGASDGAGGDSFAAGSLGLGGDSNESADEGLGEAERDGVRRLFSYNNSALVQGRAVTSMVWNKVNKDLLAVGYGKLDTYLDPYKAGEAVDEELQGGLVLFWSLRNPEYPEKVLRTNSPVSALQFSKASPMLLAVGLLSGDVLVYDVKRESDWGKPLESSAGMAGGHTGPVWQLSWILKGAERLEVLVSISTDGQVLQWSIKKGLLVNCLMVLARGSRGEGWISRQAAGLCFDFCPDDSTSYVVGTEEGSVYKCSVSYSEQYLDTYLPHSGPVYRIRFAPRWPSLFLTCSADWTMGLFHIKSRQPLFSLRATGHDFPITDAAWCPCNSTIFAAVSQNGFLQLWDLSTSCLDPISQIDTSLDVPSNQGGAAGADVPPSPGGRATATPGLSMPPTPAVRGTHFAST